MKEEGTVRTHWAEQEDPLRQFRAAEREQPEAATPNEVPRLTYRERQVLELVADGCKSADIAERLQLGRRTIETHRGKLMKKLGVHTAAAMVRAAMTHGLLRIG
jgi:DNA-binding NarL/FixJ family response regulator